MQQLKIVCYFFYCMMVRCFERADACAQDLTHLFVFHFLEIFHVKHSPLFGWQCVYCLLELHLGFISVK